MNVVFLIGYVGSDPEVRTFANGDRVASISLATTKRWTDRESGQRKEKTDWHRVRVYGPGQGGVVDTVQRYVTKGSRIRIQGELANYTSRLESGDQMHATFIEVRRPDGLELLDPARGRRGPDDEDQRPAEGEEERPRRRAGGDEERPRRRDAEDERAGRRDEGRRDEGRRGRDADEEPRKARDAEDGARKPRDADAEPRKPRDAEEASRKPRDAEEAPRKPRDADAEPRKPRDEEGAERPRRAVRDDEDDRRAAKPARGEEPAKGRAQDDPYIGIADHGPSSEPPFDDFLADEYLS